MRASTEGSEKAGGGSGEGGEEGVGGTGREGGEEDIGGREVGEEELEKAVVSSVVVLRRAQSAHEVVSVAPAGCGRDRS